VTPAGRARLSPDEFPMLRNPEDFSGVPPLPYRKEKQLQLRTISRPVGAILLNMHDQKFFYLKTEHF
jgi:hypothetical protein